MSDVQTFFIGGFLLLLSHRTLLPALSARPDTIASSGGTDCTVTVTCSRLKLAYYNLKLYELIVAKVEFKIHCYRYRYRGKSLFTYRLLTELKIPLPHISGDHCNI